MWIDYAARQALAYAGTWMRVPRLRLAARQSPMSFPEQGETVVSLTSHGPRIEAAVVAISSLLVGTQRLPVYLWLDKQDFDATWPKGLHALVERGLKVRCSDGRYGPHTKYYGTFQQFAGTGTRVITVDDDVLYPRWFVDKLLNASDADRDLVVAYRAHEIALDGTRIAPYKMWRPAQSTQGSPRHFATGVSGVAYPPAVVDFVAEQGKDFLNVAPQADDVWLNACVLRSGHMVRQVFPHPREFPLVPGTQSVGLVRENLRGGNDAQIRATYSEAEVKLLFDAPSP